MFNWFKRFFIPKGIYCYTIKKIVQRENDYPIIKIKCCPFWDMDMTKPYQDNGYCHYLKCGDWEDKGTSFLWDQVKECGEKLDIKND